MSTALELVYRYRQLLGQCETGAGLDMAEIEALGTIESLFTSAAGSRRRFAREPVSVRALLHGPRFEDWVEVINIALGGMACAGCPYLELGDVLELQVEDLELSISYRFKVRVAWAEEDDNDNLTAGFEFVGLPLLIRRGPQRERTGESIIERFAA